ncbi:MAG: hypothetical protein IT348_07740 [Candidatus Eisenbacteria bacterium]|nr:hypothetical protein [Candidatus Eisenbacteria bacterium]
MRKSSKAAPPTLLTGEKVWRSLRLATKSRTPGHVAVAFLGSHSFRRLPLTAGSLLVVNAGDDALKTGQTDPNEIAKYMRSGVEVRSLSTLHSKIYVLGDQVFVGSANVSTSSENRLEESLLQSRAPSTVAAARRYVCALPGTSIGPEALKAMLKIFVRPKYGIHGHVRKARRDGFWAVPLVVGSWGDDADAAADAARPSARRKLSDKRRFALQEFLWTRSRFIERLKESKSVELLQILTERGAPKRVEPLGRVVDIKKFKRGQSTSAVVFVEVPKRRRARSLKLLLTQLKTDGKAFRKLINPRWVVSARVVDRVRRSLG